MNYERIISDRHIDSHRRKVHVTAQYSGVTLCGKKINRRHWRDADREDTVHCAGCTKLLCKITGGKPAAPTKIVNLKLSLREYEVIASLKNGETLTQIDKRMGWCRSAGIFLRTACNKSGITIPELRSMLPYIQLVNPAGRRRKPTVYKVKYSRWRAMYSVNGKREYLGEWETEKEAVSVWYARHKGQCVYVPGKGLVRNAQES